MKDTKKENKVGKKLQSEGWRRLFSDVNGLSDWVIYEQI